MQGIFNQVMVASILTSTLISPLAVQAAELNGSDLLGSWEGEMKGFYGKSYSKGEPVKIIIKNSNGKAFEGHTIYNTGSNNKIRSVIINGFVFPGGEALATNINGYFDMKLLPSGNLHVIFRDAVADQGPISLYGVFRKDTD